MRRTRAGLMFLIPGITILVLVTIVPIISVINYSFQEWKLTETPDGPVGYVGLDNYREAFSDPQFYNSVGVTAFYTALTASLSLIIGVAIALRVQRGGRWSTVIKAMLIFPFAISLIVRGYSFRFMLLDGGVLDTILDFILPFDDVVWLGSTWWARFWIAMPIVWAWGPLCGLMMTGAVNNIDPEVYEAARVDGATPAQTFWKITLPLLRPMMFIASLLVTLFAVRMFDLIPAMTFGGPGRDTEIINYFIWRQGFSLFNIGYASALAILLTLVLIAFSYLYSKVMLSDD